MSPTDVEAFNWSDSWRDMIILNMRNSCQKNKKDTHEEAMEQKINFLK